MKNLFLLFTLLLAASAGFSQPVLTYSTHGLKAGEHNSMRQVQYVEPGAAGAMQIWDYSHLSPLNEGKTETVEQAENNAVKVTAADGGVFIYACDEDANVYESYAGPGRITRFEQPIVKIRYPFAYGAMLTGSFSARCFYGENHEMGGNMAGNYSSEADAYGVLLLPDNVKLYNVLRVKTKESYVEELCSNTQVELVKYLWYAPEYRYPVFVTWNITYTPENGTPATVNESFCTTATPTGTPAMESPGITLTADDITESQIAGTIVAPEVTYSIFPNPYNSYFHLTYTLERETLVDIALFSTSGQYIKHLVKSTRQSGPQHITYNPHSSDLAGFYVLRMTFDDKVYVQPLVKE
ncbi:MAG: T9SS type A sorting domain-containing protein [Prevotellaceae bacterium]|jgi:hypothetical protein|nr:T9SS type A sorting domain-containing protein [Prevotellaceae bacterium]